MFITAYLSSDVDTLSLHDALPILASEIRKFDNSKIMEQSGCSYGALLALRHYFGNKNCPPAYEEYKYVFGVSPALFLPIRSEEHTSELQSRGHLVCRLLLETKIT